MPNKCMNCGRIYEDDESLEGGCSCGSTLFLYQKSGESISEDKLEKKKSMVLREIDDLLKNIKHKIESKSKVDFDLQSIRVIQDGVYEVRLRKLLENVPLVIEIKDGAYRIHLASAFAKGKYEGFDVEELKD